MLSVNYILHLTNLKKMTTIIDMTLSNTCLNLCNTLKLNDTMYMTSSDVCLT